MKKKLVSLTLALALLFSLGVSALAAAPRYIGAAKCSVTLGFSGTTAVCGAVVTSSSDTTKIEADIYLQKKNASGDYITSVSWPDRSTSSNRFTFSSNVSYRSSGDYRLLVEATVYYKNGTKESVSNYSDAHL